MEWIQKDGKTILSGLFLSIRRFDNAFNGLINSRYVYVEKGRVTLWKRREKKRKRGSLSLSLSLPALRQFEWLVEEEQDVED